MFKDPMNQWKKFLTETIDLKEDESIDASSNVDQSLQKIEAIHKELWGYEAIPREMMQALDAAMQDITDNWESMVYREGQKIQQESYYGSIPGEPETPAGYGGALDAAKVQQHLSDEIDDLVRLGKIDINDLSIETVRANQEIPWDKFQAIDDEVLGDIIRDYQRRKKFYKEGLFGKNTGRV